MKRFLLATLVLATCSTVGMAQSSGTSDREGGQAKTGAKAPAPLSPGHTKPCGQQNTASSDRGGGNEKSSNSSTNNPGAAVKSGDC